MQFTPWWCLLCVLCADVMLIRRKGPQAEGLNFPAAEYGPLIPAITHMSDVSQEPHAVAAWTQHACASRAREQQARCRAGVLPGCQRRAYRQTRPSCMRPRARPPAHSPAHPPTQNCIQNIARLHLLTPWLPAALAGGGAVYARPLQRYPVPQAARAARAPCAARQAPQAPGCQGGGGWPRSDLPRSWPLLQQPAEHSPGPTGSVRWNVETLSLLHQPVCKVLCAPRSCPPLPSCSLALSKQTRRASPGMPLQEAGVHKPTAAPGSCKPCLHRQPGPASLPCPLAFAPLLACDKGAPFGAHHRPPGVQGSCGLCTQ